MAITIKYADLYNPETGEIKEHLSADTYSKKRDGGSLTCAHPGCGCELKHIPRHLSVRKTPIKAHFARMPGQLHNRNVGCPFPNPGDSPDTPEQSRLIEFIESTGQKYIYINGDMPVGAVTLPPSAKKQFQNIDGHRTIKSNRYEKTYTAKTAAQLATLGKYHDFYNNFYNRVRVAFITPDHEAQLLAFRDFFQPSVKSAFRHATQNEKHGISHPFAMIVRPSKVRTYTNIQNDKAWYYMACLPESTEGLNIKDVQLNLTPIIRTRNPEVLEKMSDTTPTLIIASLHGFSAKETFEHAKKIANGEVENTLPIYLNVHSASQFKTLDR